MTSTGDFLSKKFSTLTTKEEPKNFSFPPPQQLPFNMPLALAIVPMIRRFHQPGWQLVELELLARQCSESVRAGTTDMAVYATAVVLVDKLHTLYGNSLRADIPGYRELQFVKDMMRFNHQLRKQTQEVTP